AVRSLGIGQVVDGERNPQVHGIAGECFAEETRRRYANNGESECLNLKGRTDDLRVATVFLLPSAIAHYSDGRSAPVVVRRGQHASCSCTDAERIKVIAAHILAHQRSCLRAICARTIAHTQDPRSRLESCNLVELSLRRSLHSLVELERVEAPVPLQAVGQAAGLANADLVKPRWIDYR